MKNIIKYGFITKMLYNSTLYYMGNMTYEYSFIKSFLYDVNEGSNFIIDKCEILDETYSIISGTNKPYCYYNISYIDNNEIIVNYIDERIMDFLKKEKKIYCKKELIECGELTILIKLLNLINSAIYLSVNNNNINDLITNLKIINFDELYNLYKNSLNNIDILTNITLYKNKVNVILNKEKNRLNKLLSETYFEKITNNVNIYVGNPLNMLIHSSVDTFKNIIYNLFPEITFEHKCMIGLLIYLYFKVKSN
jgi:hypothetical protein